MRGRLLILKRYGCQCMRTSLTVESGRVRFALSPARLDAKKVAKNFEELQRVDDQVMVPVSL